MEVTSDPADQFCMDDRFRISNNLISPLELQKKSLNNFNFIYMMTYDPVIKLSQSFLKQIDKRDVLCSL